MIRNELIEFIAGPHHYDKTWTEIEDHFAKNGISNKVLVLYHLRDLVERGVVKKIAVGDSFIYRIKSQEKEEK